MLSKYKRLLLGLFIALQCIGGSITVQASEALTMEHIDETAQPSAVSLVNSPLYIATVPATIHFGELNASNYSVTYPVTVEFLEEELGDVYIESSSTFDIKQNEETISIYSALKNSGVMDSRTFESIFWIEPSEIEKLSEGTYQGEIEYAFSFCVDEEYDTTKGAQKSTRTEGIITNGFQEVLNQAQDEESFVFEVMKNTTNWNSTISTLLESDQDLEYQQSISLSLQKVVDTEITNINYLTNVVEIRLGITPLTPRSNREYKVANLSAATPALLEKLSQRPMGAQNYMNGQYFLGIDCIYIYTSEMFDLGIFTGEAEDGIPAPQIEVEQNQDTEPDESIFTPNIQEEQDTSDNETELDLEGADVNNGDGNYTADVSMRKIVDITDLSMCDALFYAQADLILTGEDAAITLYVIDPIPNYPDEGTPLSDIIFKYEGVDYTASIVTTNQVAKYFPVASGFITEEGNYYTSKIQVTIPKQAIADSVNGALVCEGFVNAVMNTTQQFYTVFSNLTKGETQEELDNIITKDDMNNSSSYWSLDDATNSQPSTSTPSNNTNTGVNTDTTPEANTQEVPQIEEDTSILTQAMNIYGISTNIVFIIVGILVSILTVFFGYAYYLKRKVEEW